MTAPVAAAVGSGSLLVSIPKAGTHMVLKLYGRAGYLQIGWGEIDPSAARVPKEELVRNLLHGPPVSEIVDEFRFLKPKVVMGLLARHLRTEIGDPRSPGGGAEVDPALRGAWSAMRRMGSDLFVPGLVVSTHLFPWTAASQRFLAMWGETGVPSIVYCYRDPRAQMVSMVNFLAASDHVAEHPIAQVYRPILKELGTMDRMLSFAISDPAFPFRDAYRQNRWMLYHPNVLKLRFEDLVGEQGGGSAERQEDAVRRWADYLGVEVPADELADGLFGGTKTFNRGRAHSWRDVFQGHHLEAFDREFGDVLADYGYADA